MNAPLPSYRYRSLETSRTIRILCLDPAEAHHDTLRVRLVHVDREHLLLGEGTPNFYEAVSYCWGDPTPTHKLLVDEHYVLPITHNVDDLLRHLRSPRKQRYLWVDAICLDQHNDRERQVQVQMMGEIYAQARKIHAWIGSSEEVQNVDSLYTALRWMATSLKNKVSPSVGEARFVLASICGSGWECLINQFYARPFFYRRWILQELALGHHITMHCGPYKLSWPWFVEGTRALQQAVDKGLQFNEPGVSTIAKIILAIQDSSNYSLLRLLWKFDDSQCSESHDRIFALYGLAQDAKDIIAVDYSEHWSETFTRVAGFYFQEDKKSIWLHLAYFGTLSAGAFDGMSYPSWVPDWNNSRISTAIMPDINAALLCLSNFGESKVYYSSDRRTVEFEGYYAGRVEIVSTRAKSADIVWHESKIIAFSEVLLSFLQRPYGKPTEHFEKIMRQKGVLSEGSRYLREALLTILSSVGPWIQAPIDSSEHSLQGATMAVLDDIWDSYDIVQIKGKRDAIGVCMRGIQLGDVLVVPPQGPINSIYWPYKGRPLFGIVVRPNSEPVIKTVHTKGQFPLYQTLSGCRYMGICCFALWEQSSNEKIDRVSVQLV